MITLLDLSEEMMDVSIELSSLGLSDLIVIVRLVLSVFPRLFSLPLVKLLEILSFVIAAGYKIFFNPKLNASSSFFVPFR